jgi:hypothetical protein
VAERTIGSGFKDARRAFSAYISHCVIYDTTTPKRRYIIRLCLYTLVPPAQFGGSHGAVHAVGHFSEPHSCNSMQLKLHTPEQGTGL